MPDFFIGVATTLFECAGQSSPRPASVRANSYRPVAIDDREVKIAVTFALTEQQKKNRSDSAVTLLNVLSAERLCSSVTKTERLCDLPLVYPIK